MADEDRSAGCSHQLHSQVIHKSFLEDASNIASCDCKVVFETVDADLPQQFLQFWNFNHAITSECFESIFCELPFAHIERHAACCVACGNSRISDRAGRDPPVYGPIRSSRFERFREVSFHLRIDEPFSSQVTTVEGYCFVRVVAVIVVPI